MRKTPKFVKIKLLNDVQDLGKTKDIVEVKIGYFRNYLLPYGYAELATEGIIKTLAKEELEAENKLKKEAGQIIKLLEDSLQEPLVFTRKSGPKGNVYGSVNPIQIVSGIEKRTGRSLPKKAYSSIGSVKSFGSHQFSIHLLDKDFAFTVQLDPEGKKTESEKKPTEESKEPAVV